MKNLTLLLLTLTLLSSCSTTPKDGDVISWESQGKTCTGVLDGNGDDALVVMTKCGNPSDTQGN